MVRSMYAGVAGMKAHQTRMDAIGNNISNVNTYGYKSSRVTFRDSYYQAMRGASAATGNKGGINPAQIGYGAQVSSIDVQHGQSTFASTGNPLDLAIAGEGFLQVQDADGNIYYTRAGMLDIDSLGNVVDSNGNFVLGVSGNPIGKAADKQKIQINVPSVNPAAGSAKEMINNIEYALQASKNTEDSNINFTFLPDTTLAQGLPAKAELTSSGITIRLNATTSFASMDDLNKAINEAIVKANGGKEHPGGKFSLTAADAAKKFADNGGTMTGAEIAGSNFGVTLGKVPVPNDMFGGFSFAAADMGTKFTGAGVVTYDLKYDLATRMFTVTGKAAGNGNPGDDGNYIGEFSLESVRKSSGKVMLKKDGTDTEDSFTMEMPNLSSIIGAYNAEGGAQQAYDPDTPPDYGLTDFDFNNVYDSGTEVAVASKPSNELGLGTTNFLLKGGTEGGAQSVKDLTGISIGQDGVIVASHPVHGTIEIGRIDLAVFNNSAGLTQTGNTYFAVSKNSGEPSRVKPGTHGSGGLVGSALEQSTADLSSEFADMITTQRGFQANSRLITVSDTMLEELINLKR